MSPDLLFATGHHLTHEDDETPHLVELLDDVGVRAEIRPWGAGTDWSAAGLVVVRSTWDYTEHLPDFLAWAREVAAGTQLVNDLALLEWNTHKQYLGELAGAGVPVVPTVAVPRGATTAEQRAALAGVDGEVVIKPAVSGGARATVRAEAGSPAAAEHLDALSRREDAMVQPLVTSVLDEGELSLLFVEGGFSHAVRKRPAAGDFRVQVMFGGTTVVHSPSALELAVAEQALACAPATPVYARVDLVQLADGPAVIELELVEPYLFLGTAKGAAERFAAVLRDRCRTMDG